MQEVTYTRRLLEKLGFPQPEPTFIYEDNLHRLVGGLDLREHFVHDAVKAKVLKLEATASADNVADLLTKPLARTSFDCCESDRWAFEDSR